MKKNKKDIYIIYKYDSFKNDFIFIKEYLNKQDIQKDFSFNHSQQLYQYLIKSIDAPIKRLLQNKYIILKDTL